MQPDQRRRLAAPPRLLTHEGRTQCVAAWAREIGLLRQTLDNRLAKGFTVAEALTTPKHVRRATAVEVDGELVSPTELARRAGLSGRTVRRRVRQGWPKVDVTSPPRQPPPPPPGSALLTHQGRTQSKSAWARELGISRQTLHERLKAGFTVEQALTMPKGVQRRTGVEVGGQRVTRYEAAKLAGISRSALSERLRAGMPLEEALSKPPRRGGRFPPRRPPENTSP